jgi:hypothetical protein
VADRAERAALEAARATPSNYRRALVLSEMLGTVSEGRRGVAFREMCGAFSAVTEESLWAEVFERVLPVLRPDEEAEVLRTALRDAAGFRHESTRDRALRHLTAYRLAGSGLHAEALDAVLVIREASLRSEALAQIVPELPAGLLPAALAAARTIADEDARGAALVGLATGLARIDQPDEALACARLIPWPRHRSEAFEGLIPILGLRGHLGAVREASEAGALRDPTLAPRLIDSTCQALAESGQFGEAFALARLLEPGSTRLRALAHTSRLAAQARALPVILEAANSLSDPRQRFLVIGQALSHAPVDDRPKLSEELQTVWEGFGPERDLDDLARVLSRARDEFSWTHGPGSVELLLHLFALSGLTEPARDVARAVRNVVTRRRALSVVFAAMLGKGETDRALDVAREMGGARGVIAVLIVAVHAPGAERESLLAEAIAAARAVEDAQLKDLVLALIAACLPAERQPPLFREPKVMATEPEGEFDRASSILDLLNLGPGTLRDEFPDTSSPGVRAALGGGRNDLGKHVFDAILGLITMNQPGPALDAVEVLESRYTDALGVLTRQLADLGLAREAALATGLWLELVSGASGWHIASFLKGIRGRLINAGRFREALRLPSWSPSDEQSPDENYGEDLWDRARALAEVGPGLEAEDLGAVLDDIVAGSGVLEPLRRADLLLELAPAVAPLDPGRAADLTVTACEALLEYDPREDLLRRGEHSVSAIGTGAALAWVFTTAQKLCTKHHQDFLFTGLLEVVKKLPDRSLAGELAETAGRSADRSGKSPVWSARLLAAAGRWREASLVAKAAAGLRGTQLLVELAEQAPCPEREHLVRSATDAVLAHAGSVERWQLMVRLGLPVPAEPLLTEAISEALRRARWSDRPEDVLALITEIARLGPDAQRALWLEALRGYEDRPRDRLLRALPPLVPLIVAVGGPAAVTAMARAVVALGRWWP